MARDVNRSPFPGMDPYLERYWGDVHHGLCTYGRDLLRKSLPSGLIARVDERTIIEDTFEERRVVIPDVKVVEDQRKSTGGVATVRGLNEPMIIDADPESITEGFFQVIDTRDGNKVITVVEFSSPVNKLVGEGRKMYRQKQRELINGGVNLVEIDLIRAGEWNLRAPVDKVRDRGIGLYHVCVTRGWRYKKPEVYAISLREKLPEIRVPLRQTDSDTALDLQILIDQVYENGSYGFSIDYSKPPEPPLNKDDGEWAAHWLTEHA